MFKLQLNLCVFCMVPHIEYCVTKWLMLFDELSFEIEEMAISLSLVLMTFVARFTHIKL